jgi:mRNA interferase RelE/StbE
VTRYTLLVKPSAKKELDALDVKAVTRIIPKMEALTANPRPSGSTKLKGFRDLWRVRVGDYRVVYAIDDTAKRVDVMRIAHRREVYE